MLALDKTSWDLSSVQSGPTVFQVVFILFLVASFFGVIVLLIASARPSLPMGLLMVTAGAMLLAHGTMSSSEVPEDLKSIISEEELDTLLHGGSVQIEDSQYLMVSGDEIVMVERVKD